MSQIRKTIGLAASSVAVALLLGSPQAVAGKKCMDRRIVRFGETTASIAQRCGVTPESIVRQNPGLHTQGAQYGVRINVPPPSVPSPRIEIRGNSAISGVSKIDVPVIR